MPDVLPEGFSDAGQASPDDDTVLRSEPDFVSAWLDAINDASREEKGWRDDADKAGQVYRGEAAKSKAFNIYHANIETLYPALYNSTPVPDVRRRYGDDDPVGKAVGDLLERALSYSIDAYDFDAVMSATVKDMAMAGRGVSRVRYEPQFSPDGNLAYEQVTCEYVPWRSFRRGPGRQWSDVPWVAFEHFLDRATIQERAPDIVDKIPFTHAASAKDAKDTASAPRFGKRAHVWEVWDRDSRRVEFICPDYNDRRLWTTPDPLGLEQFFPIPRPMQAVGTTDSLIPVASYSIYESLINELNEVTTRITKLVKQLRPRGGYATMASGVDMKAMTEAGDGELVPLTGVEMFVTQGGGLEKSITWFPLDPVVAALQQLVQQRELIKQTIYEVTKIADVMRGATNPSETLGAQQLKAQWGSLSVQRMQAEVARFARDLFRLKAEIMAGKFSMQTLLLMTGIKLPTQQDKQAAQMRVQQAQRPQAPAQPGAPQQPSAPPLSAEDILTLSRPSVEEVEQLLRQDSVRGFRVDIESDSTIRGDLARNQQQMVMFLQGIGQFAAAVGPMVEKKAMPKQVAVEILAAMTRNIKLGRQVEDALDAWADKAKQEGEAPEQPDPRMEAEKMKLQAEQRKLEMDVQATQAKHQMGMEKMQGEAMLDRAQLGMKAQELQIDQQRNAMEIERAQIEAQLAATVRQPLYPPVVGQ